jgi:LPS sulfotransferase NodH
MQRTPDIKRFMVLGSARTGSTLLLSLLSKHPLIKVYNELFNLEKLGRDDLSEALEDPINYLRRRVCTVPPDGIVAVGFKMFYYHLTEDYFEKLIDPAEASEKMKAQFSQFADYVSAHYDWSALSRKFRDTWDFLIGDRNLMVIHLRRRNTLHTLISHKTAFLTNQWMTAKSSGRPKVTIHLESEECRRYFHKLDVFAEDADRMFIAHPRLDVTYEDLAESRDDELRRICSFLDVPFAQVSTVMKKQIQAPAREIVDNFSQLKESFQHTKWSAFFDA